MPQPPLHATRHRVQREPPCRTAPRRCPRAGVPAFPLACLPACLPAYCLPALHTTARRASSTYYDSTYYASTYYASTCYASTCQVLGTCSHRKELFFYGSGFGNLFTAGLAALHGPQIPLELFQSREAKPRGVQARSWDAMRFSRMEAFCTSSKHTMLPDGRMHPACCVAEASNPKRWGCRWHENLRKKHHRKKSMWFQNAMPWVVPEKYDFATVDFTPNYLCTEKALET